ncbi:hypothetical protein COV04_04230 [Candidatus Uhrbacteria bacterium CG10_big_fil_rev_8_21_14_0_10_48_11]|uniref:ATP-grasp domain-containing protein n=1 Tax=Candidatus Uhrbacteria bacterium CG10_big_fil_rev_8_21_14_0_10_48_11 TaxID=1975037 RepID=A0A2M8LDT8_9BACT|nr:MAG: hypothetical protein COV04_04230 [Candidatus Uhrbacteria bacterium CG10_big_fil_rev_8_21_14_0_10_48_11]
MAGGYFASHANGVSVDDDAAIDAFVKRHNVDFIVVGSEAPLCDGIVDRLTTLGITTIGPTKAAAQLEASKAFLDELCVTLGISAPESVVCHNLHEARAALRELRKKYGVLPIIKADGLAAGKGVFLKKR